MIPKKNIIQVENETAPKAAHGRREFLKTALLTGGCVILSGAPLASYFVSPALQKGTGKWIDFGSSGDLPQDGFSMLSYEFMVKDGWQVLPQRGFVWAGSDSSGNIKVFSSTCTHLACNVIWREDVRAFVCPCHSGRFDPQGRPVSGPPAKSLIVLEHKVEEGNLMVYLSV